METLDWTKLNGDIVLKNNRISYAENKASFTKIGFDVFQYNNSQIDSLWILEDGDDGKQYLVAQYEDAEQPLEVKSCWAALSDKDHKNVTLLYKDVPIQRFASSEYGFNENDILVFQKTLVQKLNSDQSFVKKLINSQPEEKKEFLLGHFSELA